jgi:hypothetical protein
MTRAFGVTFSTDVAPQRRDEFTPTNLGPI